MKNITIQHFRCYTDFAIAFKPGVNLLVGDNACGKTSVLKACKYVLSSFFAGFSDDNTKWLNPVNEDFQVNIVDGLTAPEMPIHIAFDMTDMNMLYSTFTSQSQERDFSNLILAKKSKKNSRSLTSGIKDYKVFASNVMKHYFTIDGQSLPLPVFGAFSTEDIHTSRKIDAAKFKLYTPKPSFGYYECLDGSGFFPYWIKRLLVLKEGRPESLELVCVRQAIVEALGSNGCNIINDIDIRPNIGKVFFMFSDGREIESAYLSDGYRRLLNIIIDIAFRCTLLNGGLYGVAACHQSHGTVLIDEVDLHLHPSLQASVLQGLRSSFPNIQFIVSSHAPMVMSGVESNDDNVVYKLQYVSREYSIVPVVTYGMDLSTISSVVLNQIPRARKVEEELNCLFDLIDQEKFSEATALKDRLVSEYGENLPELSQAEAMLNCLDDEEL